MLGYEKGQVIGHGSFSRVHTAIHQSTGQKVALKKIRCTQGINPTALRELKLLREMDGCSPYVIRLLDAFLHKHNRHSTHQSEWHHSSSRDAPRCNRPQPMSDQVSQQQCSGLPPDVTKALMRQLLEGLASIHAHGIVHRDIKSDNLLLCGKQGCLKIADFGLARVMPPLHVQLARKARTTGPVCQAPSASATNMASIGKAESHAAGHISGPSPPSSSAPTTMLHHPGQSSSHSRRQTADSAALQRATCFSPQPRLFIRTKLASARMDDLPSSSPQQSESGVPRSLVLSPRYASSPRASLDQVLDCESPALQYTNQVCARWYRSPELLFGACNYDAGVDVWAAGCVFAEMLLGRVWLPGMSDMGQLTLIYAALGAPSEDTWPGVSQLKTYVPGNVQAPCLKSLFPGVAPDALDLLQHLVRLNPADRITAQSALEHPYFSSHPAPATQHQLAALLSRTPLQQQEQLQKRPPLQDISGLMNPISRPLPSFPLGPQRKPLARTPRRLSGCPAAYELPVSTSGGSQLHQQEHVSRMAAMEGSAPPSPLQPMASWGRPHYSGMRQYPPPPHLAQHLGHPDHYHQQGHHRLAGLHQDHQQQLYHPLDSLQLHQQQIDTPGSIHSIPLFCLDSHCSGSVDRLLCHSMDLQQPSDANHPLYCTSTAEQLCGGSEAAGTCEVADQEGSGQHQCQLATWYSIQGMQAQPGQCGWLPRGTRSQSLPQAPPQHQAQHHQGPRCSLTNPVLEEGSSPLVCALPLRRAQCSMCQDGQDTMQLTTPTARAALALHAPHSAALTPRHGPSRLSQVVTGQPPSPSTGRPLAPSVADQGSPSQARRQSTPPHLQACAHCPLFTDAGQPGQQGAQVSMGHYRLGREGRQGFPSPASPLQVPLPPLPQDLSSLDAYAAADFNPTGTTCTTTTTTSTGAQVDTFSLGPSAMQMERVRAWGHHSQHQLQHMQLPLSSCATGATAMASRRLSGLSDVAARLACFDPTASTAPQRPPARWTSQAHGCDAGVTEGGGRHGWGSGHEGRPGLEGRPPLMRRLSGFCDAMVEAGEMKTPTARHPDPGPCTWHSTSMSVAQQVQQGCRQADMQGQGPGPATATEEAEGEQRIRWRSCPGSQCHAGAPGRWQTGSPEGAAGYKAGLVSAGGGQGSAGVHTNQQPEPAAASLSSGAGEPGLEHPQCLGSTGPPGGSRAAAPAGGPAGAQAMSCTVSVCAYFNSEPLADTLDAAQLAMHSPPWARPSHAMPPGRHAFCGNTSRAHSQNSEPSSTGSAAASKAGDAFLLLMESCSRRVRRRTVSDLPA
ncbi:hypothetical protein QJQ45_012778 [Haematococcus lacustris]|nr:hypothetical protein QJQ45_012778 [Haematococcus lacustris]